MPVFSVCVLPSLKWPVTVNCCDSKTCRIFTVAGVTLIETSVAALTVTPRLPLTPCSVAVAEIPPVANPLTSPPELISATAGLLLVHTAAEVRSCVEPSL